MTYFQLFDLPVQLKIDQKALSKRYFELSRKYHPDYFVNDDAQKQSESLEISAQLNRAYKTFRDEDETIRYVLLQKGLLEEEEKYALPQDFLMEMLEINESLMDAGEDDEFRDKVSGKVEVLGDEIYLPVKKIVENYKEGQTTEAELLKVKEYYYKKKYLERIKEQLG